MGPRAARRVCLHYPISRRGAGIPPGGARGRRLPRHPRSPAPSRLLPGHPQVRSGPRAQSWNPSGRGTRGDTRVRGCERGHTAARLAEPRLSPNSRLGPAGARALRGSPLRDKAAAASPPARGASSPALLSLPRRDSVRPKGPPGRPGDGGVPGPGARSRSPVPPPPLTCSALCGSSGARRPGRRRTGFRRRRCPRPAGSRWWSPHGSAGPAAAAAAAAAAARGESSRRRRRRGGDQNAAGRIVRRLRARERAEDSAGRPRPGEAVLPAKRRGGEAPAATAAAAAAQPATHTSPVPVCAPSLRRRRLLPQLFPSHVLKSRHAPRSGREGCRAGAPSGRSA